MQSLIISKSCKNIIDVVIFIVNYNGNYTL